MKKRIMVVMLALVFVAGFIGCSNSSKTGSKTDWDVSTPEGVTGAFLQALSSGDRVELKKIVDATSVKDIELKEKHKIKDPDMLAGSTFEIKKAFINEGKAIVPVVIKGKNVVYDAKITLVKLDGQWKVNMLDAVMAIMKSSKEALGKLLKNN